MMTIIERNRLLDVIVVAFFAVVGLAMVSCGKDPVFEQGDYLYEHDDFTKMEEINGILLHWSDTMALSEEQKSVVRNLVANLVRVEGGSFRMGAQSGMPQGDNYDPEARDNESPVHEVTLSDFYLGRFEITQREWRAIMGDELDWSEPYGKGDDFPAYNVSRTDAMRFLERLSAMTRLSFRLPTEAQWEYAARGGSNSLHYRFSGSNQVDEVAWHIGNTNGVLHPVGGKLPNELGFCDMRAVPFCTAGRPAGRLREPVRAARRRMGVPAHLLSHHLPGYLRRRCRQRLRRFQSGDGTPSVGRTADPIFAKICVRAVFIRENLYFCTFYSRKFVWSSLT